MYAHLSNALKLIIPVFKGIGFGGGFFATWNYAGEKEYLPKQVGYPHSQREAIKTGALLGGMTSVFARHPRFFLYFLTSNSIVNLSNMQRQIDELQQDAKQRKKRVKLPF